MIIELHINGALTHQIEIPDNAVTRQYDRWDRSTKQDYIHAALIRLKRIGQAQRLPWELFIYRKSKGNSRNRRPRGSLGIERKQGAYSNKSPMGIATALNHGRITPGYG